MYAELFLVTLLHYLGTPSVGSARKYTVYVDVLGNSIRSSMVIATKGVPRNADL